MNAAERDSAAGERWASEVLMADLVYEKNIIRFVIIDLGGVVKHGARVLMKVSRVGL